MPGVIDGLKAVHLWLDHSRWMVKPSVSVRTHWLCYIISYYISTSTPMLVTGNPHKAHGKLTCISILLFPVYWPPYDTCHIHPVHLHTDDRGFLGFSILLNDTWVGGGGEVELNQQPSDYWTTFSTWAPATQLYSSDPWIEVTWDKYHYTPRNNSWMAPARISGVRVWIMHWVIMKLMLTDCSYWLEFVMIRLAMTQNCWTRNHN